MLGHKWPDSVRDAALELLQQAQRSGMTQTAACHHVVTRLDPAPSVHTLIWWSRSYRVFSARPPELRAVRSDDRSSDVPVGELDDRWGAHSVGDVRRNVLALRADLQRLSEAGVLGADAQVVDMFDERLHALEGFLRTRAASAWLEGESA